MERLTLVFSSSKKKSNVHLRFRLRDGRSIQLYYRSDIIVDTERLRKLHLKLDCNLELRRKVRVWDEELYAIIQSQKQKVLEAYHSLLEKRIPPTTASLQRELLGEVQVDVSKEFLPMFLHVTERQYRDGVIGNSRYKHSLVIHKILDRFLTINGISGITIDRITPDHLMDFRDFFLNEHKYVDLHRDLYEGIRANDIPRKPRKNNTVVSVLNRLQAVFAELEDKELISKNPFRKLGKERRKAVMREKYDEPIYLQKKELLTILEADVPDNLSEVKKVFLLQCALGCRISDYMGLSMENVSFTPEGIPYIHYLPQKTLNSQRDYKEVCTPLVRYAYDIIMESRFCFPIIHNTTLLASYNKKIRKLLEYCGIDRKCTVYDESLRRNTYVPLHVLASSKLSRKTHIDLMNKVQIDKYAAGLHQIGSSAVDRYTSLELKDRFVLMCLAFNQEFYVIGSNSEKENMNTSG